MREKRLRRGQALSIQWVIFALQKLAFDMKRSGVATRLLLGDAHSVSGNIDWRALEMGLGYVINFTLPLTVELSLKALILKEGVTPLKDHNLLKLLKQLSKVTQNKIELLYHEYRGTKSSEKCTCLERLLKNHSMDFINWRYLDNTNRLNQVDGANMQYVISAILEAYEKTS